MPRVRSSYGRQGTRSGRNRGSRRRRTSVATRAKYQRSARAQSSQIRQLARMAVRNSKILSAQKTYTDWIDSREVALAATNTDPGSWYVIPLTQPTSWTRVARKNEDYVDQSNTWVRDCVLNYFMGQGDKTLPVTWSLFIVTLRPGTTWDSGVTFTNGQEYIDMGAENSPLLNSGIFRVLASKSARTLVTYPDGGNQELVAHTSRASVRGKMNIKLGLKLRSPEDSYWSQLNVGDLPRTQRTYLLVNAKSTDSEATAVKFQFGAKFTCINSN